MSNCVFSVNNVPVGGGAPAFLSLVGVAEAHGTVVMQAESYKIYIFKAGLAGASLAMHAYLRPTPRPGRAWEAWKDGLGRRLTALRRPHHDARVSLGHLTASSPVLHGAVRAV
jgi:hypothetical protein